MLSYKSGYFGSPDIFKIKCIKQFSFAKNTTYGLGGCAKICYLPKSIRGAETVFDYLIDNHIDFKVLGNGSNVLASDDGFDGAVISLRNLNGIVKAGNESLFCLAGTKISTLLEYCKRQNLGGLEYLYGIPATVGGAAYMNAGVGNTAIGSDILSVRLYDGTTRTFDNEACKFDYRYSAMRDINAIITAVTVKVKPSDPIEVEEKTEYYKSRRKHLPKGRSCGCVFKNYNGISAGLLIDSAGLKGLRIGGAFVSNLHGDFIINDGGTAADVKKIIDIVKTRVFEKFGILLQEEVVYIGEFNDFNG